MTKLHTVKTARNLKKLLEECCIWLVEESHTELVEVYFYD
jgi:hypothetical protein